ncbi:RagB/SusD family nutrient uptake outer membrane protein [Pedobacter sp. ISL-68]|uniref:RagB/SusD family nutrient uptake outer membrane protein n=1 Tax=unclassified Pedobacter TaxID=2628915 RepID=UPI001BE5E12F|nr:MULTISPECIES: RagB/SusD family nutrient uptake outer membrane protein [unclassified Pedobacter]MBT2560293.1 RagB/SusD family nutrient uptake outer membrane protein [Pedobacter sp. ISL-64]MBT2589273.1 RagB/SusD family nutrient uptake outer membrane protein [Pedobacter sp. ISL-68]
MKKVIIYTLVIAASFCLPSCKKFLNIQPLDKLTGNNYFQSKEDVVANIYDLSRIVFSKINETHYIGAVGEYRSGEVLHESQSDNAPSREFVEYLGRNDLLNLIRRGQPWDYYNFDRITNWTSYYRAIQGANILIAKLDEGVPGVTDTEKGQFKAEAAFIRSLCYFTMVRLYGDVVYYTDAFHSTSLPRENFVSVLNKCIADLNSHKNEIPFTYSDPALKGVRASRGSIIALMMEMNMWNAGFDGANANKYYQATAALGQELVASNAYRLLPLSEWSTVIKGRSEESLFEFYQSINYGDAVLNVAPIADMFLHYPYKRPEYTHRVSFAYYRGEYMQKIFQDGSDKRITTWFNEDIFSDNGKFMLLKYAKNSFIVGEEDANPDNTFMIFRYGGELLLAAEALANINEDTEAIKLVNLVRARAGASPYTPSNGDLKEFIFYERSRELIGEGHHYFDLVRTKRILNSQYAYNVLTSDKFSRGAWTWPISPDAVNNNPYMKLNEYWVNGGN